MADNFVIPEFIDRIDNPDMYPVITNPDGSVSTHRMAAEMDADGKWYAFPTIVMQLDGTLKQFETNQEAMDYNLSVGNYIPMETKEQAIEYASGGYKVGTPLEDKKLAKQNARVSQWKKEQEAKATFEDYAITMNEFGMAANRPETRVEARDLKRTGVDITDPEFQAMYDQADNETQKEMLNARNNFHAAKLFLKRQEYNKSLEKTSKDPLSTQLLLGGVAASLSPTSAVPIGAAAKVAKIGTGLYKTKVAAATATAAMAANLTDEALIDLQGLPAHYGPVATVSAILGGAGGWVTAALANPRHANKIASQFTEEGDIVAKEKTEPDPYVVYDNKTDTYTVPQQDKTLVDKVPWLGEWLASDITKLHQSSDEVTRDFAARISQPTVSGYDAEGKAFVYNRTTAVDVKQEMQGMYKEQVELPVVESYHEFKKEGGTGNFDEFNTEVHRVYTQEATRLSNEAYVTANKAAAPKIKEIKVKYEADKKTMKETPNFYYRNSKNERVPYTEELAAKDAAAKQEYYEALERQRVAKEETIPQMDAQSKLDVELAKELLKSQGVSGKDLTARMAVIRKAARDELKADKAALLKEVKPKPYKERNVESVPRSKEEFDALKKQRDEDIKAIREQFVADYYAKNPPKFKTNSGAIAKAAEAYAKYFDNMLVTGQKLGVPELQGIATGRLYSPRVFDFQRIASLPKAEVDSRIRNALLADARNDFVTKGGLEEKVQEVYRALTDKEVQSSLAHGKGYYSKDLPMKARLQNKGLYLDDSKLGNLVHNNMIDTSGQYNYFMSGRYAVQHAFGDYIQGNNLGKLSEEITTAARERGELPNVKEIEHLTNAIDDILGVLRIDQMGNQPAWQLTRNIMTYNSARLMGGAGGNQVIELGTVVMMNAAHGIVTKDFAGAAKRVAKMLYGEKGPETDLAKTLINSNYLESALRPHRANRIADSEQGFNANFFERGINSLADFQMKYNGQRYMTALMEDLTGGNIIQYIQKANPKDAGMFGRWGLSMDDVRDLKKVFDADNKKFLDRMSKQQRMKFQRAVTRGVAEWVVQSDSIHAPTFFKKAGPTAKLLLQFMRFPLIAQETLMRRGMTEDKAAFVAGIFGAATTYTTMKYLREEAAIALGIKDDTERKYDIFNSRDDFERALLESVNYMANLGMLTTAWNYGAAIAQRPEIGREWANSNALEALLGPTAGLGQDVSDTIKRMVDGDFTSERQLNNLRSFMPILGTFPLLSEGGRMLTDKYGD